MSSKWCIYAYLFVEIDPEKEEDGAEEVYFLSSDKYGQFVRIRRLLNKCINDAS